MGSVKARVIDVRIVAATHQDLREAITSGRFREDLYYRLDGISVVVPPLRDRPDDIEPLARHFAARAGKPGRPAPDLARDARPLAAHDWPGNVRELRNTVERAAVLCEDGVIRVEHLRVRPSGERPIGTARRATPAQGLRGEVKALERAAHRGGARARRAAISAWPPFRWASPAARCCGGSSSSASRAGAPGNDP